MNVGARRPAISKSCVFGRAGRDLCSPIYFASPQPFEGSSPCAAVCQHLCSFCCSVFLSGARDAPATTGQPTPATKPRLKIGVALEGGGALGLAHIGVLQWFEDHHIPIDYLAGTSMGGLVGGLYSTGKTPQQLRELVDAQNWDVILGGGLPYEDLSFRRKEDQVAFPNSIVLGLRRGLVLPGGLNRGPTDQSSDRPGNAGLFGRAII